MIALARCIGPTVTTFPDPELEWDHGGGNALGLEAVWGNGYFKN